MVQNLIAYFILCVITIKWKMDVQEMWNFLVYHKDQGLAYL